MADPTWNNFCASSNREALAAQTREAPAPFTFGRDEKTGEPHIAQAAGWCAPSDQLFAWDHNAPKPKLKKKHIIRELERDNASLAEHIQRRIRDIDHMVATIKRLENELQASKNTTAAQIRLRNKEVLMHNSLRSLVLESMNHG